MLPKAFGIKGSSLKFIHSGKTCLPKCSSKKEVFLGRRAASEILKPVVLGVMPGIRSKRRNRKRQPKVSLSASLICAGRPEAYAKSRVIKLKHSKGKSVSLSRWISILKHRL